MSERLPCQIPGCLATILPTTALKTGGICMPCHQKKLALEKETYILKNRKDVDRYAGIIDPVEILKIMHTPRKYNPLENDLPYHKSAQELYNQLTEAERKRLETYAISLMDRGDFDQAETILLSLVCFTDSWIEQGLNAFYHKGKYYPGILYKKAGPAIRDELIHRVECDSTNRNHLLLALAWIGDEVVIQLFEKWRQNPPQWASKLYGPPENYAHEAGWELDQDGRKRLLFHTESYHFKVCGEVIGRAEQVQSAVMALQKDEQVCHWCGGKLVVLFDYNLQDPLVWFMKLPGQQLRIAGCMRCNCYGTIYMKVEQDGRMDGNFNISRIERYLTLAKHQRLEVVILLNKIDLCDKTEEYLSQVNDIAGGSLVLPISAANKIGLDPISNYMTEGRTIVFLGSSGVGKSTLLNSLLEQEVQTTNQTSNYSGKGKHTTTHRQLFFHNSGCMVVDTPGMKELQLWAEDDDLDSVFTDIVEIVAQCKFSNCTHRTEPDCALQSAIDSGVISRERYERYLTQLKELSRLKEKKKEYMEKYNKKRSKC